MIATVTASAQTPRWMDVIRNLRNPDVAVRLKSLQQLNDAGYASADEFVAPLIGDPDPRVQTAALDAELTFYLVEPIGERFRPPGGRARRSLGATPNRPLNCGYAVGAGGLDSPSSAL